MPKYAIGVDVGGTFTDLVYVDEATGQLGSVKVPSSPPTFLEGVMHALHASGVAGAEVEVLKHGSTIATNAIIERRGVPTGLLTTRGFRDVLEAGRCNREEMYNLAWEPPRPLVPRRNRLVATERVDYRGEVLVPLVEQEVRDAARCFRKRGIQAVAVVFLNSFMNEAHERRAREILEEELPDAYVCASYEILPELQEFERTSTTVANAYLGPLIERYLARLNEELAGWGYRSDLLITHSGGGIMTAQQARRIPARTCQSGPAAGVMGAAHLGVLAGHPNLITLDVGGTSADLALVEEGRPLVNQDWKIEYNVPIRFPAVDLVTIGAGGGSIARVDEGGTLKVGPQSAGARPGPASYGQGGTQPTTTDANLVLGRLNPATFLGGQMALRPELARAAIAEQIAPRLRMSVEEAAAGILRVANSNMLNAMHLISVQRGYDPREFALMAFGGAGPLHAVELARELGIPIVIVPPMPGLTSALGALTTQIRHDFVRPIMRPRSQVDVAALAAVLADLAGQAQATLEREGIAPEAMTVERVLDVRYYGQAHALPIPLVSPDGFDAADLPELERAFTERHLKELGYTMPSEVAEIEIVNARVAGFGATYQPPIAPLPRPRPAEAAAATERARKGWRPVYFSEAGGWVETAIYDRRPLLPGSRLSGPAIVEQSDSTTVLPPGASAEVDDYLNLVVRC